jgi:hypothetical protein
MSDAVSESLNTTMRSYALEDSQIKAPALAFFALSKGAKTISNEWMTEQQRTEILNHVETRENAWTRENIELFRRNVPHARIVEIPQGHHYCFIEQEELVYEEMRKFLME